MIEKSVLHLVSLSPEAISLAASRLRRATIDISKDVDAKHLHSLQRDIPQALALLASSFPIKQTSSSHKTILVWLARESPALLCDAIRNACSTKQDSIPSLKDEQNINLFGFQVLRCLAATSNQLPISFVKEVLPILSEIIVNSTSAGPSAYTLLARDLVLHLCERLSLQSPTKGEDNLGEVDIIYDNRVIVRNVLQKECDWARLIKSPLLFLGLSNVVDDLSLLITNVGEGRTDSSSSSSSSDEKAMNDVQTIAKKSVPGAVQEINDDEETIKTKKGETNQAMLDSQGKEFLRSKEINTSLLSSVAHREFSAETIEKASSTLMNAKANALEAAIALRNACLSLGRIDSTKQKNIPLGTIKSLLEGSIRALNDANFSPVHHKMASAILKSAFSLLTSSSSQADMASKLIPLLDERKDGISIAAAELIAESVHSNPTAHLLELDVRLAAKEKHKRENSVLALFKVIELRSQKRWESTDFEKVDEMLAGMLLKRLGDENIDVRRLASKAFSYINPRLIVPKLCGMLGHQSEKSRSGALEALCGMLKESTDLENTLECLLRLENIQDQELCFNLANRWIIAITLASDGEERFSTLVRVLVRECMSRSKENPLLMGLARRVGQFVAEKRSRQIEYCSLVLNEIDVDSPDLIVFQRLTPLLLLRVVPRIDLGEEAKFDDDDLSLRDALMNALQQIVKSSNEEREVRRIACECIAQMVGSPPWVFFLSLLNDISNEEEMKRAAIYGMCHCVVCRIQEKDFGTDAIPFVAIQIVLNALNAHQSQKQDYEKLVIGIQEFLALALVCEGILEWKKQGREAMVTTNRQPVVEELIVSSSVKQQVSDDENPLKILSFLMERLLVKTGDVEPFSVRSVVASALSLTARSLLISTMQGQETSTPISMASKALQAANMKEEDIAFAASGFARMIVTEIVSAWSSSRPPRDEEIFVIFNSAFASIKHERTSFIESTVLNELVRACVAIVQTPSASKISTLKLIGLLLALPEKELKSLEEGMLGRMYTALKSLSNVDSDPAARALASELLNLSFV